MIQQVSHLRLVVPVPEEDVSGIVSGASVPFQVPAWSGTHLLRRDRAHFPCARSKDAHHGGRTGRDESRWIAGAGNVSDREVAGAPRAAGAVRAEERAWSPRPSARS